MTTRETTAGDKGARRQGALNRNDWFTLLLLLILAVVTRFYRLGDASFWADEVFTLKFASLPWSTLWVSAYDATPPLYFSIIRLMLDAGIGEWWLRLPSAIAGTLTVLFVYLAVRKLADSRAALATALLLTLSVANIEYSQEARAYALVGMWIALSFLGLATLNARWADNARGFTLPGFLKAGGALYGLAVLAALYSHNVAVFYWIGAQFFFLGWWITPFKFSRALLASWFAVNFFVLLLWIPWLLASLQVIDANIFVWLSQYEFLKAVQIWRAVNTLETGYSLDLFVDAAIILLAVWGLVSLRRNISMAIALLAMLVFSSLVIWAYGFFSTPIFMRRTVLWGSIFTFTLVGIGISRLPLVAGRLLLLILVCTGLLSYYNYNHYHRAENADWRSPTNVFNERGGKDDVFLFRTTWQAPAFLYYLERDQLEASRRVLGWSCTTRQPLFGTVEAGEYFSRIDWSESDPGWGGRSITTSTVWVIDSLCYDSVSVDTSDNWLAQNWTLANSYGFKGVTLHQWIPKTGHRPISRPTP